MAEIYKLELVCGKCHGDGDVAGTTCYWCKGSGRLWTEGTHGLVLSDSMASLFEDTLDKCNDILDKCNDILEKVS
jgi:RecJ-like exonuclease